MNKYSDKSSISRCIRHCDKICMTVDRSSWMEDNNNNNNNNNSCNSDSHWLHRVHWPYVIIICRRSFILDSKSIPFDSFSKHRLFVRVSHFFFFPRLDFRKQDSLAIVITTKEGRGTKHNMSVYVRFSPLRVFQTLCRPFFFFFFCPHSCL